VSKTDYPYPEDEFDQVDLSTRPKEVHAARRSAWSRAWPFLLVVVLVPLVAFVAVKFLANSANLSQDESPVVTSAPADPTNSPGTDASPAQPTAPPTTEPTAEPTDPVVVDPTADPNPDPVPQPPVVVDFAMNITVYNDTSDSFTGTRQDLAARTVTKLAAAGFSQADRSQDNIQANRANSLIYYPSADAAATADAIAQALGITALIEDPQIATGGIVVSLGDDFTE